VVHARCPRLQHLHGPRVRASLSAVSTAVLTGTLSLLACSGNGSGDTPDLGAGTGGSSSATGGQHAAGSSAGVDAGTATAGSATGGRSGSGSAKAGGGGAAAGGTTAGSGGQGTGGQGIGGQGTGSQSTGGTSGGNSGNTVHGTVGGQPFEMVSNAWLIGAPDDPQQTRVIYVFDKPVACSEISMAGWDTTITNATQAIEIKLIGTKPAKYPVATGAQPATGEASVNYTLSATTGTPAETLSKGGSVTLDAITDGKSASGSFDLTFPSGSVTGTFDAAYCANGHEP
jgi:hypothetical protein